MQCHIQRRKIVFFFTPTVRKKLHQGKKRQRPCAFGLVQGCLCGSSTVYEYTKKTAVWHTKETSVARGNFVHQITEIFMFQNSICNNRDNLASTEKYLSSGYFLPTCLTPTWSTEEHLHVGDQTPSFPIFCTQPFHWKESSRKWFLSQTKGHEPVHFRLHYCIWTLTNPQQLCCCQNPMSCVQQLHFHQQLVRHNQSKPVHCIVMGLPLCRNDLSQKIIASWEFPSAEWNARLWTTGHKNRPATVDGRNLWWLGFSRQLCFSSGRMLKFAQFSLSSWLNSW